MGDKKADAATIWASIAYGVGMIVAALAISDAADNPWLALAIVALLAVVAALLLGWWLRRHLRKRETVAT